MLFSSAPTTPFCAFAGDGAAPGSASYDHKFTGHSHGSNSMVCVSVGANTPSLLFEFEGCTPPN
ncbi:hypothetical protein PINS_up015674 [Pythium insidiosum]|nr:hypothetical protein PINS_up015674 [Pythium insidiosum]